MPSIMGCEVKCFENVDYLTGINKLYYLIDNEGYDLHNKFSRFCFAIEFISKSSYTSAPNFFKA